MNSACLLLVLTVITSASSEQQNVELLKQKALEAIQAGRYAKGIHIYEKIYKLTGRPEALFNIGMSHELSNADCHKTISYYKKVIEHPLSTNRLKKATNVRLTENSKLCPHQYPESAVAVNSAPSGAEVMIDGQLRGLTPLTTQMSLGRHQLTLRLKNYDPINLSILVSADKEHAFHFTLKNSPQPKKRPSALLFSGWSLVGLGTAALATSLVFEIQRANTQQKQRLAAESLNVDVNALQRVQMLQQDIDTHRNISTISFVSGTILLTAGTSLLIYKMLSDNTTATPANPKSEQSVRFLLGPSFAGVRLNL